MGDCCGVEFLHLPLQAIHCFWSSKLPLRVILVIILHIVCHNLKNTICSPIYCLKSPRKNNRSIDFYKFRGIIDLLATLRELVVTGQLPATTERLSGLDSFKLRSVGQD